MVKSHLMHTVKTICEMDNALLSAGKRLYSCAVMEKKNQKMSSNQKCIYAHLPVIRFY